MNARHAALAGLVLWLGGSTAQAVESHGSIETVGQAVIPGNTASSKFQEYQTMPRGFFVKSLDLSVEGDGRYVLLEAFKPGLADQRVAVELGVWGLHKLSLAYDQTPHLQTNTAQTLLVHQGNGVFTLPNNVQLDLQTTQANAAALNNSPFVPVAVNRKKASLEYSYRPTGPWRGSFRYWEEKREGSKIIGITYGHGQLQEALEPINYQTHNVMLSGEYVGKDLGFSAAYLLSSFQNDIKRMQVDNPFRLNDVTPVPAGATRTSAPGTAALALPPDNQTHQLSLGFNAKTTEKSRVTVDTSYALQLQDTPFLPFTSNNALVNLGLLPDLPAPSLKGDLRTFNTLVKWNWKPLDAMAINLRGAHYNVENKTPMLYFDRYVQYDTSMSNAAPTAAVNPTHRRAAPPRDYAKSSAGADVYYAFARSLSAKLAYDWERMDRRFREIAHSSEHKGTISFKFSPSEVFVLRPSYQFARKFIGPYSAEKVAESTFPLGEGTSLGQIEGLRKPDEAARKQHRVTVRAELNPLESLDTGVDFGYVANNYDADYGVNKDKSYYYSLDGSWRATERLNFYADFTWEKTITDTLSRYRATGLDTPLNDWAGRLEDTSNTYNAAASYSVIPEKLSADIGWSMTDSRGTQRSNNPNGLFGTAAQQRSALAINLPATYNRLQTARASAKYRWLSNLSAKLGWEFQKYTETDWAQDTIDVFQPIWNKSVFLGASTPGYEAHIVSLNLAYNF